ncbi:MAG: two-component system phosphate regulon response regulator PhoB, partial [Halieaceae bacterium]|jgi:two-component system phosphate regulon response regulator PhoB
MADTQTILVVDDDEAIRDMLAVALELSGFSVMLAEGAQEAHASIVDARPDLVLLDWMMPGTSGLELLRRLRRDELTAQIPVIMLTARTEEPNRVSGLDAGADDYIAKPFSRRELISRVRAVLRRSGGVAIQDALCAGELRLEPDSHRVTIADQLISIGPTEYRLLKFFMSHTERVYTRGQILDRVWGANVYLDERTVDVHIRRLRKAIGGAGHDAFLQTVRGAGYRFSTQVNRV